MKLIIALLILVMGFSTSFAETMTPETIGKYEVLEEDFVYAKIDGIELRAHIYKPKIEEKVYAVVDAHPGAWNYYDRMAGQLYNKALASSGLLVMAVDFRQGPKFKHPLASRDLTGAVRYLRVNAEQLNINPDTIGLIGSSSGGHLALLAGIRPNADIHKGTPIALPDGKFDEMAAADAKVDFVIALWPVSDPFFRYEYAKKTGRDKLVAAHDGYFSDPSDMKDAGIAGIIKHGEAEDLPPILVVQPGKDKNIPEEMTFDMIQAYQTAGGYVDYAYYPDQPHAFAHKPSNDTDDCINLMHDFIKRQLKKKRQANPK